MRVPLFLAIALMALGTVLHGSPAPAPFTVGIFINQLAAGPGQATETGKATTFEAAATGGSGGLMYQWDFGDGSSTVFDPAFVSTQHTYVQGAHLIVRVNVQDALGNTTTATAALLVHYPIPSTPPTNSSTIILDSATHRVWCVNADQDTVSAIDANTLALVFEVPVGKSPRTLARAGDGTIWVVSQQHASISVLDPGSGTLLHVVPLPHGSLPYGIAMTPDGTAAYVTFQGSGGVAKISTASRDVLASTTVPPAARGVSVSSDGRVFVTRFISPQSNSLEIWNSPTFLEENRGEVVELSPSLGLQRTINLVIDPGQPGAFGSDPDFGLNIAPSANGSRGVPNYLTSMVITPDGRRAFVPSKKDNLQRGTKTPERDGRLPSSEVTYRAVVSSIDLTSSSKTVDELAERFDVDNAEMPQAACSSPLGDYLFVAMQGNNRVQVREMYDLTNVINNPGETTRTDLGGGVLSPNGLAPQGLVLDPSTKKLFVHNYMGRAVSVFNATAVLASHGAPALLGAPTVVGTVVGGDAADKLAANNVLQGKRVFYNASDVRMSRLGYVSCAGCHLDGGSDMRVWDFTNRGEGFRNTIVLQGRGGTGMGNVHWSANFNEIQDFDNDIFFRFHDGPPAFPLDTPTSFTGSPNPPLAPVGSENAGRDPDLDALAAYVGSLNKVSRSPFRNSDGTLTAQGAAGEAVFKAKNCQKCHKGRNFTDSTVGRILAPDPFAPGPDEIVLHNVGTLKPTSGNRLGGTLPGIDTPTLKGLWQSAPYLHDGSASTLMDVFADATAVAHFGSVLTPQEKSDLVQYMLEIDEVDAPPVDPAAPAPTITIDYVSTGKPYSAAQLSTSSLPFIDRSYRLNGFPGNPGQVTLIRTAEDDKSVTADTHLTLSFTGPTQIYVAYDDRASTLPNWLNTGWAKVSLATQDFVGQSVTFSYYGQTFPSGGTVTLGGNLAAGAAGALRNYYVIVYQPAQRFEEGPLSFDEWVHDRDADGDGLRDEYEASVSLTSPWTVDTGSLGTIPDEDRLAVSGRTLFQEQASMEAPAPASGGGGGGGGGCGFVGLEALLVISLAALRRGSRTRSS